MEDLIDNKTQEPSVLILVPMFNEELMIGRCIESVCRQTYKNWIIYCQDNASIDGTFTVVTTFAQKNPSIYQNRLETNISADKSFNLVASNGLDQFSSDYVCYMGADDYWENEDYLEKMINQLQASQAVGISAGLRLVSENDENISDLIKISFVSPKKVFRVIELIKNRHAVNAIYGIYVRSAFEQIVRNGGALSAYNGSDWWWVYSGVIKGKIINNSVVTYRKTVWSHDRRRDFVPEIDSNLNESQLSKMLQNVILQWKSDVGFFSKMVYGERKRLSELNDWTIILVVFFFMAKSIGNIPFSPFILFYKKMKIFVAKF